MPYTSFDPMGNYTGGYGLLDDTETEEERRKRLAKEAGSTLVGKTEIQTWADGSQTHKTTQEIPAPGPVAPGVTANEDLRRRMWQAESGNRDYTATGEPVTSPAGAMFATQVMPSTAAQPGFGIRPAQAQTPEEYNRVGNEYFDALLRRYGGDQQKALAAYNAGPGRVEQNMAANQGQLNVAQLPRETQGYLGKVLGGVRDALIPSAQAAEVDPAELRRRQALAQRPPLPAQTQAAQAQAAAPAPAAPVAPQAAPAPATAAPAAPEPVSPYSLAAGMAPSEGFKVPTAAPMVTAQPSTQAINTYQQIQDNPAALLQLRSDTTQPEWIRERAGARAYEMLDAEVKRKQAEQQAAALTQAAAQGDRKASLAMARELQKQEGSWLKMILLGFLSPDLAGEEAVKLGFGARWQSTTDASGNPVLIQTSARGLPLQGFKADGSAMTPNELISYGGGKKELDIVGGSYVNDQTGEVGRLVTDKKTGQSYIQTDKGVKPMTGFRPQSSMGTLADMRTRAIQDINLKLQGKGVEEQMAILRDYNKMLVGQGYSPVQPGEVGINVPQIGGAAVPQAAPQVGAPGAITPTAPVAPGAVPGAAPTAVPAPGAPAAAPGQRPTMTQLEAGAAGAKKEAEVGAEDVATVRKNQGKAEQNADYLLTKIDELVTHPGFSKSVGVYDIGGIPLPYGATVSGMIPGSDVSDWRARFEEVKGQSFLNAIENLKGMGALSDREGAAATQAIQRMRDTQSEKEFKAAARDFQEIIQRGIDRNRQKLGQEPKYGTAPESAGTTLSPADKAQQELERRKRKQ